jgi:hypothetical protein
MRRALTAGVAAALLSGCSVALIRPTPKPSTATAPASCRSTGWALLDLLGAGVLAGVGKLSTARFEGSDPATPRDDNHQVYYGAAVVLTSSAVYGIVANLVCNGRADEDSTETARALHQEAADAARTGDCSMARANDLAIRDLDSQYHAAVFRRDAAIQRCLDAH